MPLCLVVLSSVFLLYAGLSLAALAMVRHQPASITTRQLFSRRAGAASLVVLSLLPLLERYSIGIGTTFWLGLITLTCLMLSSLISFRPKLLASSNHISCILGSALLVNLYLNLYWNL